MLYAVSLSQTATSLGIVLTLATLVGLWLTHYKVVRPWWRRIKRDVVGGRDVLVGRPAIVDPVSKKEIAPPLASLGERLEVHGERLEENQAEINGTLKKVVALLESQQAQDRRLNDHEDQLAAHDDRIVNLENGVVERVVTKAESAAAFRAIEAIAKTDDDPELG
jgi:hypothetical protein